MTYPRNQKGPIMGPNSIKRISRSFYRQGLRPIFGRLALRQTYLDAVHQGKDIVFA
jgi:hypothetical protein